MAITVKNKRVKLSGLDIKDIFDIRLTSIVDDIVDEDTGDVIARHKKYTEIDIISKKGIRIKAVAPILEISRLIKSKVYGGPEEG